MKVKSRAGLLAVLMLIFGAIGPGFMADGGTARAEETNPATIYTFDLKAFLRGKDDRTAYDYLKLASALQGLANRERPQLYYFYESGPFARESGMDMDRYWFDNLREVGNFLHDYDVVDETDFFALLTRFGDAYNGLVVWDETVPATSNVASTVAGADNLLPVRFDASPGSVYSELIARGLPVTVNLAGLFTGQGTIPGTSLASTGSTKNDAYLWAKSHYLDSGKTNPTLMEYAPDGASWHNPAGQNNSRIVSMHVPDVIRPGQTAEISLTFKNTGTTTWDKNGLVRLGSIRMGAGTINQFVWSAASGGVFGDPANQRVFMGAGEQVGPGQQKTFRLKVTAPNEPGVYAFAARMVRDGVAWMGDYVYKTIEVTEDGTPMGNTLGANLVSYDFPKQIGAGQRTKVSVTLENTGTSTWTKATFDRLGSTYTEDGDDNKFVWDITDGGTFGVPNNQRLELAAGEQIAPGERKTFTFFITAPAQPGDYTFWARMVRDGVAWVGNPLKLKLSVLPAATHRASLVSHEFPREVAAGWETEVAVTFLNTGTSTWTNATFDRLGSTYTEDYDDNKFVWSSADGGLFGDPSNQRVDLKPGEQIAPGERKTFTFSITAPSQPGFHTFWARMVRDGVAWMGEPLKLSVPVVPVASLNATPVSVDVPIEVAAGKQSNVSVTFENTGTATWSKATFDRLGSTYTEDYDDNKFVWSSADGGQFGDPSNQRVELKSGEQIAPGGRKTFAFAITAPEQAGTYTFWARMVRDGVAWMGQPVKLTVKVTDSEVPQETAVGDAYYPDLLAQLLPNADYFIANKAFFFDLSPDANTPPDDDPQQATGTDVQTLKALLASQRVHAGGDVITICGFVPWMTKYTDAVASPPPARMNAVQAEWTFVDIVSAYYAQIDADVGTPGGLSNASVFTHVPLHGTLVQQNDKGAGNTAGLVNGKKYVLFYMSDFDSAGWLSGAMPSLWDDPQRGELPLAWSFATDLSKRVPQVFNYMYETMTPNDYFVSGDNGTGYLNPMMLEGSHIPSGMTSMLGEWETHNRQSFERFDLDITGFLISGLSETLSPAVQDAYSRISPVGVGTNGGYPARIVNGTPFTDVITFGFEEKNAEAFGEVLAQNLSGGGSPFRMFRTLLTKPSVINGAVEYVRTHYPNIDFEVVDPYTYFRLYKEAEAPSQNVYTAAASAGAGAVQVDGVASGGEWSDAAEIVVSKNAVDVRQHGTIWGNVPDDTAFNAKYRLKWDDANLYLLEERTASSLNFTAPADQMYFSDATMLFLDLNGDKMGNHFRNGDYSISLRASGGPDGSPQIYMREGRDDGATEFAFTGGQIASSVTAGGYTLEAAIPWSALQVVPFAPATDRTVGMTLLATHGDGGPSAAWGQVMWAGDGDNQAKWANMTFAPSPAADPGPEEIVAAMADVVDAYTASGDIRANFAAELKYRLNIISILLGQGAGSTAQAYMQDLRNHILDPAVLQQRLITAEVAGILDDKAAMFIFI